MTRCLSTSRHSCRILRRRRQRHAGGEDCPSAILGKNPGTRLTDLQKPWRRICARARLAVGGELQLIPSGPGLDVLAET